MPSLFGNTTGLPQTTRSKIPYEIESLSVRFNRIARASNTIAICRIDWDFAGQWVEDMVGKVYMSAPSAGGAVRLRRFLPERNPFDANQWCIRCEQVEQGGGVTQADGSESGPTADAVSGWPVPKWMKFRCVFEAQPFQLLTDAQVDADAATDERELYRYVIRGRRPKVKELQVPGGAMFITGSGPPPTPLMQTSFKRIVQADVQYVHVRVPVDNLPLATWDTAMGTCNLTRFDFGADAGYEWPIGTLLYLGYDDADKYWDASGNWVCDVVHSFEFKEIGWNAFMSKNWVPVAVDSVGDGTGTRPYSSYEFANIFKF